MKSFPLLFPLCAVVTSGIKTDKSAAYGIIFDKRGMNKGKRTKFKEEKILLLQEDETGTLVL